MMKPIGSNVVWHEPTVTRGRRADKNGHKSVILWFTGLSGAGKSTIAHAVEETLYQLGCDTYVLDGDNVRHGLCGDLGFSDDDRTENIRRIGEMAKLFLDAGVITISAFISPFKADRQRARDLVEEGDFIEVHCHCPLDVCEARDPKGLYKKARAGLIKGYTGISSPYEEPEEPEIKVDTSIMSIEECVASVISQLQERGIIEQSAIAESA
ncbi:MAG: adenylyl-sulfate kinase [Sedimenticola sp.]